MKTKSNPRRDFSQIAFDIVQQATGEAEKIKPLTGRKANSSKGGKIGGKKRAESLSEEQRIEQAKKAANKRWASPPANPVPKVGKMKRSP